MNIPDSIKKRIDEFVDGLKSTYGDGLVSVILYGSGSSGEYAAKHSNINLAVILNDASPYSLSKISGMINKRKFLTINPVFFTQDYINRSTDVFPIEFMDMKENHVVLYGKDILKDISVDIKNLRFQCEQELKSKIINIKRLYLRTPDRIAARKLLFKSLISGLHILRNLIRLKGKTPPYAKGEVLNEISREFGIDTTPLQRILNAKNENLNLSQQEIADLFSSLVSALEAISDKVDHF